MVANLLFETSHATRSIQGCSEMNTIILFVEYLLSPVRIVRIRIMQFRRSLLKRREVRLQKRLERIDTTQPDTSGDE